MEEVHEDVKVYESVYNFVKENPDMVATELSAIAHMAEILTKDEIVLRCVAIRNALWDLEEEETKEALGAME